MSADFESSPGKSLAGNPPATGSANWRTTLALLSLAASIGLLLAALLVFNHSRQQTAPAAAPASAYRSVLNWQAADFTLPALTGEEIRLMDHRGKVVFLNFWETWCAPCRVEMPDFAAFLAEQDEDSPLALFTINGGQNAAQIREFYDELGIAPLPTLLDTQGEITALYGVLQLPQTFILDGDGVARARILGIMDLEEMRSHLAEYSN